MERWAFWLGDVFIYTGFPAIVVFTVFYGLRSKWTRYPESRALFAKSLSLALISLVILLSVTLGPEYPGRAYIRASVFGFFCFASWWFAITLLMSQHRQRAKVRALEDELEAAEKREGVQ